MNSVALIVPLWYSAPYLTGPRYLSSQATVSLVRSFGGMNTPDSNRTWRLSALGVPSRRNIGSCVDSTDWNVLYRPLSISVGIVTRGAKLIWEISGNVFYSQSPAPESTATLRRFSTAGRIAPSDAPQLYP